MVAKRSTKMGKIKPYIDVRSAGQVPQFESLLKTGPVIVLVYADWCGHCKRFKQNMWDEVANSSNKTMNTAAVHYDMVDKTSMKNASIEGYPTLFEVSSAKTPVAVPTPQSKEDLMTLVNSNINNNMKSNIANNVKPLTENNMESYRITSNAAQADADTFEPQTLDTLPPETEPVSTNEPTSVQGGGARGGSLLETLLKVTVDTAHVALLASSAAELNRRFKKHKKTKKRRSVKKHQTRRH